MHEGNSKFSLMALAVSLNLRRKQSIGKISLWERVRGTFVTARIVTQGWLWQWMSLITRTTKKKYWCKLSFSAYRTSRKHLYLFRRHLSLLIRDYINGNTHVQADTRQIQQGTVRVYNRPFLDTSLRNLNIPRCAERMRSNKRRYRP